MSDFYDARFHGADDDDSYLRDTAVLDHFVAQASNMLEEQMRGLDIEATVEDDVVAIRMSDEEAEIDLALAFTNGSDVEERIAFMLNIFPQAIQSALSQMEVK